ncbi:MAG: gliding motility-associated C-terminal domain-containing protein, partial [Bacteroidetes bacterium]|nr:gliding motility-associated C-terminal domain-containing protein [Bacteroidota bacterium]
MNRRSHNWKGTLIMRVWKGKFLLSFLSILLTGWASFAQPINDNCSGATTLQAAEQCTPVTGSTAGATQSAPSCSGTANDDVWYKFSATQPDLSVKVVGSTSFNPVLQVFSGFCGGSSIACVDQTGNGGTETVNLTGLTVGATYWFRVHHAPATISSNPIFSVCVSSPAFEPICNLNSPEPANRMNPCNLVPKICEVNGFCGTTRGYHATPGATNYTPYSVDTWPELTSAFCGTIENNSFAKFVANQPNVGLRVFGSCVSGSGIQMMCFTLNTPMACNSGPITTYGCQNLIRLTPAPQGGFAFQFTNLVPGQTYYLMIDGNAGAICDYKVAADYGVRTSVSSSPAKGFICLGNSITLNASGGDGTYAWNANPDLNTTSGSTVIATPTTLGTKNYIVNSPSSDPDCPGSEDTSIVIVTTEPIPDAGFDEIYCLGDTIRLDGTLTNSSSSKFWQTFTPGITPPPSVQFKPNFSSLRPDVIVNKPGTYYFILNENSPTCGSGKDTVKVVVFVPSQTVTSFPPTCKGDSNGQVVVNNQYGQEYSIDGGLTWSVSSTLDSLKEGGYLACSRFKGACMVCDSVYVAAGQLVTVNSTPDTTVCENASIFIQSQGFSGTTFDYVWQHIPDTIQTTEVSPTYDTLFLVHAINENGCKSEWDSIAVNLHPSLSALWIENPPKVCYGDSISFLAEVTGGNGQGYQFLWSNNRTLAGSPSRNYVSFEDSDSIFVRINDNCESTPVRLSSFLEVLPLPIPDVNIAVDSMCELADFIVENLRNTSDLTKMEYTFSNGETADGFGSVSTNGLKAGTYGFETYLETVDGCTSTTRFDSVFVSMPVPVASFKMTPLRLMDSDPSAEFEVTTVGNYNYLWYFQDGSPGSGTAKIEKTVFPKGMSGFYLVELEVYSDFGCSNITSTSIEIVPDLSIYIPNSFTPDDDEHNPTWRYVISGIDVTDFSIEVYNRWGEIVWKSKSVDEFWDGKVNGQRVPNGAYVWNLKTKR